MSLKRSRSLKAAGLVSFDCAEFCIMYELNKHVFSRRFYPKRLTVHSGYTCFLSVHVFPGNRTHNLCAANTMLYHWATGSMCLCLHIWSMGNVSSIIFINIYLSTLIYVLSHYLILIKVHILGGFCELLGWKSCTILATLNVSFSQK